MKQQNAKNVLSTQHRKVNVIDSTLKKYQQYSNRLRGDRSQTKQLNIHMKTLNKKLLKRCILIKQLNKNDKEVFQKYKQMKPNFQSLKFLYQKLSEEGIKICTNYSKTSQIAIDILKSDRMFVANKLIFIKFLKKVEMGISKPNQFWKQQYFKNKKSEKNKTVQASTQSEENTIQKNVVPEVQNFEANIANSFSNTKFMPMNFPNNYPYIYPINNNQSNQSS